jgi:dTDP-4-amino-4,6-dideoxygalactose transaminase
MENKLALFGGQPMIARTFDPFKTIGDEEVEAAVRVVKSGALSGYIGADGPAFMGGKEVLKFESEVEEYFGVKYAIAVNSWTSGLVAAVGAIGIEPGDEVITTPWTMAATATAILHFNGIPIFADIERNSFNIDPDKIQQLITPRTRAVIAVDIFGRSADVERLRAICDQYGIKLISDTAQAPGALYKGEYAGTLSDIGGFSLNYHKHIHCGEGGVLVTNDQMLATRLRLLRNHAEAVIKSNNPIELCNMLGYNFRMGEIEAAIASSQLKKLEGRVASRQRIALELSDSLSKLPGLSVPQVSDISTNAYYIYGITLNLEELEVSRELIIRAITAEGVPNLMAGYQNIHLLPMFREKIAYGTKGFPWTSNYCDSKIEYGPGLCPIAEELHSKTFIGIPLCMQEYPDADVGLVVNAFHKVWRNLPELRKFQNRSSSYD